MKKETATDIIDECYARSLKLLEKNSHDHGVIAAARTKKSVDRNYASIFGRDAAICSLGMVASGDKTLIRHAKKGLLTLARFQAPNGQIPKYVKPEKHETDFWYSGCIDATLWWLYAVDQLRPRHPLFRPQEETGTQDRQGPGLAVLPGAPGHVPGAAERGERLGGHHAALGLRALFQRPVVRREEAVRHPHRRQDAPLLPPHLLPL